MFRNPRFELLGGPGGGREHITPELRLNPGFELVEPRFNLKFEIYVQTLGFGNSMFEPGVLELYVRTLGSGTLCPNPGFGELHVRTPGSGTPPPQRVRTLGSGTPCSNPGFGEL